MFRFLHITLLAAVIGGLFAFTPTTVHADDYWDGYWSWYDGTYRPYYHRHYAYRPCNTSAE